MLNSAERARDQVSSLSCLERQVLAQVDRVMKLLGKETGIDTHYSLPFHILPGPRIKEMRLWEFWTANGIRLDYVSFRSGNALPEVLEFFPDEYLEWPDELIVADFKQRLLLRQMAGRAKRK